MPTHYERIVHSPLLPRTFIRNQASHNEWSDDETVVGDDGPDFGPLDLNTEVIDLTGGASRATQLLRDGEISLAGIRIRGRIFKPGDVVEVTNVVLGSHAVDFVQLKAVVRDRTGNTRLRGTPLSRTRNLQGKLPRKMNEVCMILHIKREALHQARSEPPLLVDVCPHAVTRKRKLRLTNAVYPEYGYISMAASSSRISRFRRRNDRTGLLVCRWALKIYITAHGRQVKPEEEVLERLSSSDVPDSRYRVSEETLCNRWRGGRVKGGSWDEKDRKSVV